MSDAPQAIAEDLTSSSAVEHHVMDILNPTLHHHDLLQSYVRTRVETGDSKQDFEEFEEPSKEAHLSKYPTAASGGYTSNARYTQKDKGKKSNDRKGKDNKSPDSTIESEMRIQKSRRK
ncbi:uncharacterized protein LOC112552715 [Pogonomyrmex barbatus]|uniref:Uncharacterized protein LOC112552715 n=1 Tax=Pogonomyrmex barbatus TaxID=144034 RepID=A0A8N1S8A7_9HYME|nr:uncharacterized protein LOC112552715 [Pogonomyrmex barbatus]